MAPAAAPGTIRGTVRLNGPVPKRKTFKMDAEPPCLKFHSGRVLSEEFVVDPYGNVQWAFVYVKSGVSGKVPPAPTEPVVMDQVSCIFTPHVVGVRAGQPILFVNSDALLHNVHAIAVTNKEFNFGLPKPGSETKVFDKPEIMVPVKCDVHPWMKSYVGVLDHPYFSVTNAVGSYAIEAPAGNYLVAVWHEKCGPAQAWVAVGSGQTSTYDFVLDAKTD
jgi:plastocyanin